MNNPYLSTKIAIRNARECEEVQKILIEAGCRWIDSPHSIPRYLDAPYLYVSCSGYLTWGSSKDHFDSTGHTQIKVLFTEHVHVTYRYELEKPVKKMFVLDVAVPEDALQEFLAKYRT